MALGFLSAFYGVAFGLTQQNPKVILAYSSISQMGVITAALGVALVKGQADGSLDVAFYAANHLLVKAALFLTIGALATRGIRRSPTTFILAALLALSLAGLPLTGGALAKLATKAQFAERIGGVARHPFFNRHGAVNDPFPDLPHRAATGRCPGMSSQPRPFLARSCAWRDLPAVGFLSGGRGCLICVGIRQFCSVGSGLWRSAWASPLALGRIPVFAPRAGRRQHRH